MIECDLLKLSFVWSLHNTKCIEFILKFFGTAKYDCIIKTREMLSFLPLVNNYVTFC